MRFVYGLLALISAGSTIIFTTKASGKSLSILKKKETWKFIGKKATEVGKFLISLIGLISKK